MAREKKEDKEKKEKEKVHPRIGRRNVEVKREAGQRRLRFLSTSLALLAIIIVTVLIFISPLLNIDRLIILGAPASMKEQIIHAGDIHKGEPLIEVRTRKVERGVETLPNIQSADVQVHWPHEVKIRVKLRTAAAVFKSGKNFMEISEDGVVMLISKNPPAGLVQVSGKIAATKLGKVLPKDEFELIRFITGLTPANQALISNIEIHSDHTATATLKAGSKGQVAIVELGEPTQMDAKAVALETILQNVKLRDGLIIDVRNAQTPVVSNSTTTTSTTTATVAQSQTTVSTVLSGH
jgi:cell division septal protein FtsQ